MTAHSTTNSIEERKVGGGIPPGAPRGWSRATRSCGWTGCTWQSSHTPAPLFYVKIKEYYVKLKEDYAAGKHPGTYHKKCRTDTSAGSTLLAHTRCEIAKKDITGGHKVYGIANKIIGGPGLTQKWLGRPHGKGPLYRGSRPFGPKALEPAPAGCKTQVVRGTPAKATVMVLYPGAPLKPPQRLRSLPPRPEWRSPASHQGRMGLIMLER
jgi:hypothetical protein